MAGIGRLVNGIRGFEREMYVLACIPIYGGRGRDFCCDPAGSQETAAELGVTAQCSSRKNLIESTEDHMMAFNVASGNHLKEGVPVSFGSYYLALQKRLQIAFSLEQSHDLFEFHQYTNFLGQCTLSVSDGCGRKS